jgi:hypothetical protein
MEFLTWGNWYMVMEIKSVIASRLGRLDNQEVIQGCFLGCGRHMQLVKINKIKHLNPMHFTICKLHLHWEKKYLYYIKPRLKKALEMLEDRIPPESKGLIQTRGGSRGLVFNQFVALGQGRT